MITRLFSAADGEPEKRARVDSSSSSAPDEHCHAGAAAQDTGVNELLNTMFRHGKDYAVSPMTLPARVIAAVKESWLVCGEPRFFRAIREEDVVGVIVGVRGTMWTVHRDARFIARDEDGLRSEGTVWDSREHIVHPTCAIVVAALMGPDIWNDLLNTYKYNIETNTFVRTDKKVVSLAEMESKYNKFFVFVRDQNEDVHGIPAMKYFVDRNAFDRHIDMTPPKIQNEPRELMRGKLQDHPWREVCEVFVDALRTGKLANRIHLNDATVKRGEVIVTLQAIIAKTTSTASFKGVSPAAIARIIPDAPTSKDTEAVNDLFRALGFSVAVQSHTGEFSIKYSSHRKKYHFNLAAMRKEFLDGSLKDLDW